MAKQGMKRERTPNPHPKNDVPPVPQLQGKARTGKEKAKPIIAGTGGPELKVYHDRPAVVSYRGLDNDLALENLENDIPFADLQDL